LALPEAYHCDFNNRITASTSFKRRSMKMEAIHKIKNITKNMKKRLKKLRPRKDFIKKDTWDILVVFILIVGAGTVSLPLMFILSFLKHFMEPLTTKQQIQWTKIVTT
jgi:hypothetical protein